MQCLYLFSHHPVSFCTAWCFQSPSSPFLVPCAVFIPSVTILSLSRNVQCLHLFSYCPVSFYTVLSSSLQSPSYPFRTLHSVFIPSVTVLSLLLVLRNVCIHPVIFFSLFGRCLVSWSLLGPFPVPFCIVSLFLQSEMLPSFSSSFCGFNPSVTCVSFSSTV